MTRFYPNRFVASLAITALTVTAGFIPAAAMASEGKANSTYNVQTTQSLINNLTRLGGFDRYDTAVQIADNGWQSASTAVLAPSGDLNMVDALASSSLAKAVDGPILLTDRDSVPYATMTELKKLGVTKVYMVSGTAVISAKVESDLTAAGIQSIRLGGNDRYETAINIAKEIQKIKPYQEMVVTNSYANVDAVSIAPIAAAKGIPILLVDKDSVPTVVSDFIKSSGINKTYVIGGTAVVSDSVKDALPNAIRLGGNDRFDTNKEVLKEFKDLLAGGKMFFANGSNTSLIDSLTGAPLAAKLGGAIVLSNKESVPDGTKNFIQTDIALKNPGIFGGTAVMSDTAIQSLGYTQPDHSAIQNGSVELSTPNATYKDITVNGNILVDADGETLQNIHVNGTIFVDPGKDGTTNLDGVQAKRVVVLSGADHSIYLKGTQSDSLVVSSSSDVHVVAETGTAIGSTLVQSDAIVESESGANVGLLSAQSHLAEQINVLLQGTFSNDVDLSGSVKLTAATDAVIPTVNVAGAIASDSIQLAGQFPNVSISDNSSITVLSGKVGKLETKGTSNIVVKSGAEITNLVSAAGNIKVSGGGTVNGITTTDVPTDLGSIPSTPVSTSGGGGSSGGSDRDVQQTAQPVITGTVRAGDTTISGTAEAGATVSIKRSGTEIGTATADVTTGAFTVTLNGGVILAEADELSITATKSGKTKSNVTSVTVAAALVQTTQPTVTGTVRAGDTAISGTAEAGAAVSIKRSGSEIGTATADGTTGAFTVSLNDGVTLAENDTILITATAPGKTESNAVSVTISAALVQTTQPTVFGTVSAGETKILGTAEAGATVGVKRSEIVIGTATANETTGAFMVILNDGVTLAENDTLLITATAPGKTASNTVNVTVAAPLVPTTPPTVTGTIRVGDTAISGTAEAEATVCVMRSETEIGTATVDANGVYTVTVNDGVILAEDDVLSVIAKAPDKAMSEATSVTIAATLVQTQTIQPIVTGTVRAGDTSISGTAEAGAAVSVKRSGTEIGTATADGTTSTFTVNLNNGVTLAANDTLLITATETGKTESNATSVTVEP